MLRATAGDAGRPSRRRTVPAIALALVAVVALVPPYVAVRQIERGDDRARRATRAAPSRPTTARRPPTRCRSRRTCAAASSASRLGDEALARRSFEAALDVQEHWVAHFELGLLDAQAGRFRAAEAQLRRAAELNRNDPLVTDAIAAVEGRNRLDPQEVNERVLEDPVLAEP